MIDFDKDDWVKKAGRVIDMIIDNTKYKVDFNDHDWSDCRQMILLHVLKKKDQFDERKGEFGAWVRRIALMQCYNYIRNKINERVSKHSRNVLSKCGAMYTKINVSLEDEEVIWIPDIVDETTEIKNVIDEVYFYSLLSKKEKSILDLKLLRLDNKEICNRLNYRDRKCIHYHIVKIREKYLKSLNH
jgi:DNA-directed RNA polymerase specialized sigma24 family protein